MTKLLEQLMKELRQMKAKAHTQPQPQSLSLEEKRVLLRKEQKIRRLRKERSQLFALRRNGQAVSEQQQEHEVRLNNEVSFMAPAAQQRIFSHLRQIWNFKTNMAQEKAENQKMDRLVAQGMRLHDMELDENGEAVSTTTGGALIRVGLKGGDSLRRTVHSQWL